MLPRDLELIGVALGLVFWLQMIRLCAARETPRIEKFLWLLFIVVAPGIGALSYFLFRFSRLPT